MASDAGFVQYVADQLSGAGEVRCRKMFGEYGLYLNGKFFALICDDRFFVKDTPEGRAARPRSRLWHRPTRAPSPACWWRMWMTGSC